jgi:ABC-type multidrug transport system fused ATPase/permease subunit
MDGYNIKNVAISSLRNQISIVSQHTILFNETIRYNIAYGMPDATMEVVIRAAKAANAHDFIARFPDGYDTCVGEMGMRLSGGERQRIAIARALLRDGRTVFVIAHRLSTVKNADTILVIEGGEIVEQGTHEELMASKSRYKVFYEKQFKTKDTKATASG